MDLSSGALPMGMLFFGMMVLGVVRRKAGNVVARSQYPKLADKLGLSYRPSSFKDGVGKIVGQLDGYQVTVDPDDQRRIYLRFDSQPEVELHSFVHNKRAVSNMTAFRPTSSVLSSQFKTAHASTAIARRLNENTVLDEAIKPLRFLRSMKNLSATSNGISATFDYGSPPYIPAEVVEDVLPRLVHLAQVIEGQAKEQRGIRGK